MTQSDAHGKRVILGLRRNKVAELRAQGLSQRAIGRVLGIGKTTIGRDFK